MAEYVELEKIICLITNDIGSLDTIADKEYAIELIRDLPTIDIEKSPCGDCQEFDCYGCEYKH